MIFADGRGVVREVEALLSDHLHRAAGFQQADPRIVLFGIDEASLSDHRLGRFPWTRGVYATAIRNLQDAGHKGLFFDIMFKSNRKGDMVGDTALARALSDDPRVVVAGVLVNNERGRLEKPVLFDAADYELLLKRHQIGLIHSATDEDGVVRAGYLAHPETDSHGWAEAEKRTLFPAAATALLLDEDEALKVSDGGLKIGDRQIDCNVDGFSGAADILIRFGPASTADGLPPKENSYPLYSFSRLLDPTDPIFKELEGKYLLVGQTLTSGQANEIDRINTVAGRIKGVEVHARILDNLLNDNYLRYPPLWVRYMLICLVALSVIAILARYREAREYWLRLFGLAMVTLTVYVGAFSLSGYILDLATYFVTLVLVFGSVMLGRYFLTYKALTRVIPEEIAAELLFEHTLKDRRQIATILLTDIRGYTTLSEGRTAVAMLDVLNEYHKRTVACYERYGGQALTYQGDAQIVVFGVFGNRENPAADAVAAALGLQSICDDLREEWGIESRDDFDVGAGLCTGEVEVGLLGGGANLQYSVVGETVRKAHKVQSLSADLEAPVILDEETYQATHGAVEVDDLGMVQPKGLPHEIRLYRARKVQD